MCSQLADVCERHPDGAHRKVNGQSEEAAEARFQEMVPWEDDSVPTVSFLTDDIVSCVNTISGRFCDL